MIPCVPGQRGLLRVSSSLSPPASIASTSCRSATARRSSASLSKRAGHKPCGNIVALEFAPTLLTSRSRLLDSMCALGANQAVYGDRTARQVHIISR